MTTIPCPECAQPMRDDMERCPHCYRPCHYPNVNAARRPEEQQELQRRYDSAWDAAKANGGEAALGAFETAIDGSEAVISRLFPEVIRLSYSEDEVYATFYQRVDAGLRLAGGDAWDHLRAVADTILFGEQNKRQVRFASLTLDGAGLPHYGDCSLVLREEMIAHRASVFEENSVMFMKNHNVRARNDHQLPKGYKAVWADRKKLAVAKSEGKTSNLKPAYFATVLQRSGKDEKRDVFMEVHIWGSLTVRSISRVVIKAWRFGPPSQVEMQVATEKLAQYNVLFHHPPFP